jgi:hypothetical protein
MIVPRSITSKMPMLGTKTLGQSTEKRLTRPLSMGAQHKLVVPELVLQIFPPAVAFGQIMSGKRLVPGTAQRQQDFDQMHRGQASDARQRNAPLGAAVPSSDTGFMQQPFGRAPRFSAAEWNKSRYAPD